MELAAVIAAVSSIPVGADAIVVSDSTYVVKCFTELRHEDWELRGWRTKKGKPVANLDLWRDLLALVRERTVTFESIRGHSGDYWNEMADRLATGMTRR